jgi:hypothetical protein
MIFPYERFCTKALPVEIATFDDIVFDILLKDFDIATRSEFEPDPCTPDLSRTPAAIAGALPATPRAYHGFFPVTSRYPEIPRRRIVVEIVDVSSPKFHKFQQVLFSKLLNLKIRKKGGPLSPRRLLRFRENPLFLAHFVSARCGQLVESC